MDQEDVQEEFRQTMDPSSSSSSNYEKIDESIKDELDKLADEESDSEGFSDGDADDELGIDLIKAAMEGNAQIFDDPNLSFEHLSRKSSVLKNNILHIAVRYEQEEFVRALLTKKRYMAMNKKLISEKNSHGNTPFHLVAQLGDRSTIRLMYGLYKYMKKKRVEGGHDDDEEEKPWRAQNSEGDTALHLALLSGNLVVANYLVKRDGGLLARMVNNSQEAPLHLAITHLRHGRHPFDYVLMTSFLLKKATCVATWRDAKGLTPLLRAASLLDNPYFILEVTKKIIDVCPESTLVCDPFGKSFLHLLIHNNKIFDHLHRKNLDKNIKDLICLNEISILINHQDQDGHTPLHIALKCDNIHMARFLVSKCSANLEITNKDRISASSMIQQLNLWHQLRERRTMTKEESSSANKGNISFLLEIQRTTGLDFYGSQDSNGNNFLHLLMSKTTEHHYLSSSDDCREFFRFIESALLYFPNLVCGTDQIGNTPLHILAQNKDFCKTLADSKLAESRSLLSKLLSICDEAITISKEADNHDLPWVMQNSGGNTPLHEAIIANNRVMVLELLCYRKELARIVNKHKKTPLHLLAATSTGTMEFTVEEIMEIVNANIEALGLLDKDGLIPILTALKAENQQMVVAILRIVQNYSDNDGQNSWHLVLNHSSKNFVNGLLQSEAFRNKLQQKDKDGYTTLHLAMKEKCFGFVDNILETWGREQRSSGGEEPEINQWLMDFLKIVDKDGLTPIIRALNADNPRLATRLCHVNPEAAKKGDNNGKTIWHLLSKPPLYKSEIVKELCKTEALRKVLEQKDKDGNTPLHLAIKDKCPNFVQDLLETWGRERQLSEGEEPESNQWLMELLIIRDKDGLTPIITALNADNPDLATRLCQVNPEAAKKGDSNGKTIWHLLSKPPLYKSEIVKELLKTEALRKVLEQKDKDGNTPLHLAIKDKCLKFVQDLLEASGGEHELSEENSWPMDLLRISNNAGEIPEDLLADLSILPKELEKILLTDRRLRGIRSSWGIPRTQLQNYMSSMNVIAALQTTFTFTAAFAVPGGLSQEIGTPILIQRIAFQVFMISDVIAMCLSMMVLICLLWMVATNKRESVMIQDFALTLLLASFVATLFTFMTGVYATIYPAKPWIAITTLVLCSLLMLFLHRYMLTNLLLLSKYYKGRFVKKFSQRAHSSNTQEQRSDSAV